MVVARTERAEDTGQSIPRDRKASLSFQTALARGASRLVVRVPDGETNSSRKPYNFDVIHAPKCRQKPPKPQIASLSP